jgi:phytoene desaturase (3,4-didehydrolycopene-forming)
VLAAQRHARIAFAAADARQKRRRRCAAAASAPSPPAAADPQQNKAKKVVAVVGGGVGGLCTAAILAREAGHRVVVLEQSAEGPAGGRCQGEWLEAAPPSSGGGGVARKFRFDTGPSLLLLPDAYRRAFARMLGVAEDEALDAAGLELRRVGPDAAYRVFFTSPAGGGREGAPPRHLDLLYDEDAMAAQLDARQQQAGGAAAAARTPSSSSSSAAAYRAWLRDARRMLDAGFDAFIARDFGSRSDGLPRALLRMLDLRVLLPLLLSGRLPSNVFEMLEPHAQALARRFPGDPDLQALLSFQDLYVGLSPQSAPGVFSLLAATELQDGVWYPVGGFGAVRDALVKAARGAGDVEVRTGARVRRVIVVGEGEGGGGGGGLACKVEGVEVEDVRTGQVTVLKADAVVCNADVPSAYALLSGGGGGGGEGRGGGSNPPAAAAAAASIAAYGQQVASELLAKGEYSAGVIAYYWCVEGGALTQLPQHSVFVRSSASPGEAARAWRRARSAGELDASPNFYVHCPARTDPTAVVGGGAGAGGGDSVMVLLPVANLQQEAFDGDLVAAGRRAILRALADALPGTLAEAGGAADLAERIAREEVRAPPEWQARHALAHGAAFGLSHGLNQLAAFRPALKDGRVRGFYCVGASARPGNGVPLVLTGAGLCADAVMADLEAAAVEAGGGG